MEVTEAAWYLLLVACWVAIAGFEIATFRRYWRSAQPDPLNSSTGALRSLEFLAVLAVHIASIAWAVSLVPRGPLQAFAETAPVFFRYAYAAVGLPFSGFFWLCYRYAEHVPFPRWPEKAVDLDVERAMWLLQFLLWFLPLNIAFIVFGGIARG